LWHRGDGLGFTKPATGYSPIESWGIDWENIFVSAIPLPNFYNPIQQMEMFVMSFIADQQEKDDAEPEFITSTTSASTPGRKRLIRIMSSAILLYFGISGIVSIPFMHPNYKPKYIEMSSETRKLQSENSRTIIRLQASLAKLQPSTPEAQKLQYRIQKLNEINRDTGNVQRVMSLFESILIIITFAATIGGIWLLISALRMPK